MPDPVPRRCGEVVRESIGPRFVPRRRNQTVDFAAAPGKMSASDLWLLIPLLLDCLFPFFFLVNGEAMAQGQDDLVSPMATRVRRFAVGGH